ncbi:MAG TPA: AmiS/UreI family transporter [Thauera sp.]|mgnify:CR=1 FL=1|nr:AmiS/UreI family transporter [Thauera sp.]HRA79962.1 AmiS/UreI family transporter [Thauera sp.]
MLLGLSLFYVGAVLILNGLWMLGRISDREITVINLFTGGLNLLVSLKLTLGEGADAASIKAGAFSLLFALTYLWVAFNRLTGADGRGLGWFSLFVAITAVPIAIDTLSVASTPWSWWFGLSWAAWALLWLLFFLVLVLNKPLTRLTAGMAIAQGILTGWLPGYLLLTGAIA